jgi:FMN phosphatase YigB (HAD superfamily)
MIRIRDAFGDPPWAESLYRGLGLTETYATQGDDAYRQDTNRLIARVLRGLGVTLEAADVERLRVCLSPTLPDGYSLTEGAAAALAGCRQQGLALGVVTNTICRGDQEVACDWARLGIEGLVDFVVSSHSAGWAKPHRKIFEVACARAGVSADQAVMIGNRYDNDIVGAKRFGARAVWKTSSADVPLHAAERPDATIGSLAELPAALEDWA